ncbi:hypothetical protein GCWU000341_02180 [Oribacterium sp. oral taxon 078 str. F0262]|uniref:ribosome maturation factor RimP n=1 Tax=Oribacterium sp. oral taxon 078 TaxID=652706 RepID=UPI0001BCB7D1|nr:ribosome assembly cofactor RimP [Oribacterium sp. oral taxon 078]EFE91073.1 hypothetical protein GCWU000341_02180 [Oribacterium sp. oral taxon 078 str. F0262]
MITEKTEAYLREELAPSLGYELDSVSYTREDGVNYLRVFILRKDGEPMTTDDCAAVSRPLSRWLDKEDFIEDEYVLEVCSLGFKDEPEGGEIPGGEKE